MKLEINQKTIRDLGNLKGRWLIRNNDIHIIKDFQYIVEKPQPEPEAENTTVFKRKKFKKKVDTSERFYLTSIAIQCYNNDLKFVGSYIEDYCERLIAAHNDKYATLTLYDFATAWERLKDQINAIREFEKEQQEDVKPDYMKQVKALLKSGNKINAIKAYKDGSGKSLEESRDFVNELNETSN
jgi:ribosomal protein L7/L12